MTCPGAASSSTASKRYATAALIVLMIVWGSTFVVTKAAAREIPPLTLAALRFIVAAAVLVPVALRRGWQKRLPRPVPWMGLGLMGLTGVTLFTVGFNHALVYGSASQGALIYALVPAGVAFAAAVGLRERPSKRRIVGIVLSIAGVLLVVPSGEQSAAAPRPVLGAACMLAAVGAWSVYTVLSKQLANVDQVVVIAWMSLFGVLMLAPLAGIELFAVGWRRPSATAWIEVLFLGTIASGGAFLAYGYILRYLDASSVGVYSNLDPIVGLLTAVLFLDEALHGWQAVGGVISLCGMWLASTNARDVSKQAVGES